VDAEGVTLGSRELDEQVLSLAAAGRYIAVLTSAHLYIYNKDLSLHSETDEVQGVRSLILFPDGSAELLTDALARLYIA
jgi:hypothetical protein